ncbi:Putative F0F1-ATPase subunit Ca2+/Mg2+ transporter [Evansella caseinilytica]|uniref:Putative F0F1-ATPase subunit Ca2+/Mg2+ transporter n=1 Tax=Evansella caseinilytica TaxID=1503961 RepID=A0A1H3T715_9BACI|nr:AtpZ/AtpI family protein [Evansella caseinilytica]SDZ45651.1 Putative F0F1-ATPase subunit Ca2+/Mg2+ transporter [Evansella caseinilytica]
MEDPSKFRQTVKAFALMTTISSYFTGAILIGIFGGRWLDNHFGFQGLFLIIGFLLGLGTAVMGIYYAIRQFLGGGSS